MKVKFSELREGDVIYPIGYGQHPECCAVVESVDKSSTYYSTIDFSPMHRIIANIFVDELNEAFPIMLAKENLNYNVIYRRNESKDKEDKE